MGVPAFFRWLCKKYPSIVVNAVEQKAKENEYTNEKMPLDCSEPNPNGVEFDNLYLDMNGIIHPCTHPEDRPAPKNEDEMMIIIFEFIDRIFSIVRPRKLLYMAIDGVAPRAKMNQQRSRRFRAAKESCEKESEIKRLKDQIIANGGYIEPDKPNAERFDSNCITPGTPFMQKLAECLRYYIHDRLQNDPGWRGIKVILSDANVPGEGEHKIMDYIRRQRANPDHDPNTHHVLCGADADLIMLGLATHEPYFTIIREEFRPDRPRPCEICSQFGHETKECTGMAREKHGKHDELSTFVPTELRYIFLRISVLREYLARDLFIPNLPFGFDLERIIDDWVFMCFFVGNDFLPHLPSLEIREGAIDRLVRLYKENLPKLGGYLTNNGEVNLGRAQVILSGIGQVEDDIFKKRQMNEQEFKRRQKEKQKRMRRNYDDNMPGVMPEWMKTGPYAPVPLMTVTTATKKTIKEKTVEIDNAFAVLEKEITVTQVELPVPLQHGIKRKHEANGAGAVEGVAAGVVKASKVDEEDVVAPSLVVAEPVDEEANDPVRLWEDGWRERYYKVKFDVNEDDLDFRYKVAAHYAIGLCWVLKYYYQGVPAWNWYFPYHYAPFASDFQNLENIKLAFDGTTEPFRPFEQLMAVFPAASKKHIPKVFQSLMYEPDSPIIDFYPDDFQVDLNGKKASWQGVALLPFVDEARLKKALEPYVNKLNETEKARNTRGDDNLFIGKDNELYEFFKSLYADRDARLAHANGLELDTKLSGGIGGRVWCDEAFRIDTQFVKSPIRYLCPDLNANLVLCVKFRDPQFESDFVFKACILPGAKLPEATLKPSDWDSGNNRGQYRPSLGFNGNDGYRQNKDASVANRMVQQSMNVQSSAHGGVSTVYGSYKTSGSSYQQSGNNQQRTETQYQRNYSYDYSNQQRDNRNYQRQPSGGASGSGGGNGGGSTFQQFQQQSGGYRQQSNYNQQQQQFTNYNNQRYHNLNDQRFRGPNPQQQQQQRQNQSNRQGYNNNNNNNNNNYSNRR